MSLIVGFVRSNGERLQASTPSPAEFEEGRMKKAKAT
jgi:hypothetical protein